MLQFQSTRPRGARHVGGVTYSIAAGFNPRAHAGRDKALLRSCALIRRFNPRAHAGRDHNALKYWALTKFQSTRPRGARL